MGEQRKFTRVEFIADAKLELEGQKFEVSILDISLKGALLLIKDEHTLTLNKQAKLSFTIDGRARLSFDSTLVHHHEEYWGVKFMAEDIDSFSHLRRICKLNSKDPDCIEKELAFLLED